jgi:hypothetical protein
MGRCCAAAVSVVQTGQAYTGEQCAAVGCCSLVDDGATAQSTECQVHCYSFVLQQIALGTIQGQSGTESLTQQFNVQHQAREAPPSPACY